MNTRCNEGLKDISVIKEVVKKMNNLEELYLDFGKENGGTTSIVISEGFCRDVSQSSKLLKLNLRMR